MQSVTWIGFGSSNSVMRTVVHFFPAGRGITAPYPANCTLRIFGLPGDTGQVNQAEVVLEGARLSQPDGVRLEQAFAELKDGRPGFFGLSIEVSTVQPRIDLSASLCLIELWSRANSVRFWPVKVVKDAPLPEFKPAALLLDGFNSTAFIVVNAAATVQTPELKIVGAQSGAEGVFENCLPVPELPAHSVLELPVGLDVSERIASQESSWGPIRSAAAYLSGVSAGFLLYRDVATKRPVSVCKL